MTPPPVSRLGDTELEEIQARCDAATPGPWFYNSYSGVFSSPMVAVEEAFWTDERDIDGHSYEHRVGQTCEACGERWITYPNGQKARMWGCAHSDDALDHEARVATVPPSYGDTATGIRKANADLIAHAPADLVALLGEIKQLRQQIDAVPDAVLAYSNRQGTCGYVESPSVRNAMGYLAERHRMTPPCAVPDINQKGTR